MSDVEAKAREAGWKPLEQWKGNAEKWTDAETYLERVEHALPLVRTQRDKLMGELSSRDQRINDLEKQIQEGRESMDAFREYQESETKRQVDQAKRNLRRELAQANKDGDVEAALEIEEAIDKLKEAPPKETKKEAEQPKVDPAFQVVYDQWRADGNQWYGADPEKTMYANGVRDFVAYQNPGLKGRAFLDKLTEVVEDKFPSRNDARERPSKVEETRGGGSPKGSGKSYADLPPEAKTACESFSGRLVGKDRTYKTEKEWRDKYARDYFGDEA